MLVLCSVLFTHTRIAGGDPQVAEQRLEHVMGGMRVGKMLRELTAGMDLAAASALQSSLNAISGGDDNLSDMGAFSILLKEQCGVDESVGREHWMWFCSSTHSETMNYKSYINALVATFSAPVTLDDKFGFAFDVFDADSSGHVSKRAAANPTLISDL